MPFNYTKKLLHLVCFHVCLRIAVRNQFKTIQLANVRFIVEVVWNAYLRLCYLNRVMLAGFRSQHHYPVRFAEIYDVYHLNRRGNRMYDLVSTRIQSRMRIPLFVWNELTVKILVVPAQQYITGLYHFHYLQYVVAVNDKRFRVICQDRKPFELEYLYLPKICQEPRPYLVQKILYLFYNSHATIYCFS